MQAEHDQLQTEQQQLHEQLRQVQQSDAKHREDLAELQPELDRLRQQQAEHEAAKVAADAQLEHLRSDLEVSLTGCSFKIRSIPRLT